MKLLKDGEDLTGRKVIVFGIEWVIKERNYLKDWVIERRELRENGWVKMRSSISQYDLSPEHPHCPIFPNEVND